jgi:sulfite reductase (NADPH) hemoprotein beta-component
MAAKPKGPQAVTANRLGDGIVIFLTAEGTWAETPRAAAWAEDKDGQDALLRAAEASHEAVGPYLIEVSFDAEGCPHPTRNRERIRALGPTVRRDLGKQAELEG